MTDMVDMRDSQLLDSCTLINLMPLIYNYQIILLAVRQLTDASRYVYMSITHNIGDMELLQHVEPDHIVLCDTH